MQCRPACQHWAVCGAEGPGLGEERAECVPALGPLLTPACWEHSPVAPQGCGIRRPGEELLFGKASGCKRQAADLWMKGLLC